MRVKYHQRFQAQGGEEASDLSIETWCFKHWKPAMGTPNRAWHFKQAMRMLFYTGPNAPLKWTPWTDRRVDSVFGNEKHFTIWWGPAAAGKTTDAAAIALTYFLMDPANTTVTVASTTREMLEARIWGEVVRLYTYRAELKGQYVLKESAWSITIPANAEAEQARNVKAGIFGVAVLRGTSQEALANLSGRHNQYCLLIIDEMQGTKEVAVDAFENIQAGCVEANFLGMGNPSSWLDVLGKYSLPKTGNTKSLNLEMDCWETREGWCHFFNGLKSPGVTDPKAYPFLLNAAQIARSKLSKGEHHPLFWQQRIGFIPPEGLIDVMMSENFLMQNRMLETVEWAGAYRVFASLDPAFSTGGDEAIFTLWRIGSYTDGTYGLLVEKQIPIQLRITDKALTYQLAADVIAQCNFHGIRAPQLAVDTTGMQGMFVDILESEWKQKGVYRCSFSSKVSDLPDDIDEALASKKVFHRRGDQLWGAAVAFGRRQQLRGITLEAAQQFAARLMVGQAPLKMETKKEMKEHFGRSPDHADSIAVGLDYAREVLGFLAGGSDPDRTEERRGRNGSTDIDSDENLYTLSNEEQLMQDANMGRAA